VPQDTTSIVQEGRAAFRGLLSLVVGDQESRRWFNLTTRGLLGSFIALIVVTAAADYIPVLQGRPGMMLRNFAADVIVMGLQWACSAIVLRQVGRPDGFVPYLVADNWNTAFVAALSTVLALAGAGSEFLWFPMTILVLLLAVNVGRLIVGLPGLQAAMFVVAQLVGLGIGMLIVSVILPLPDPTALSN